MSPTVKELATIHGISAPLARYRLAKGIPLDKPLYGHRLTDTVPRVAKTVTVLGTAYRSVADAARTLGLRISTVHRRLRAGEGMDQAFRPVVRRKPPTIRGVAYPTVAAACRAWGVAHDTVAQRMKRAGMTLEQAVTIGRHDRSITLFGVEYPTMAAAAKAHNISPNLLAYRRSLGLSDAEMVNPAKRQGLPIMWNGNFYPSFSAACRAAGIRVTTGQQRVNVMGWSRERALSTPCIAHQSRKPIELVLNGKTYRSIKQAAEAHGLNSRTVMARLGRKGWPVERAFDQPVKPKKGSKCRKKNK